MKKATPPAGERRDAVLSAERRRLVQVIGWLARTVEEYGKATRSLAVSNRKLARAILAAEAPRRVNLSRRPPKPSDPVRVHFDWLNACSEFRRKLGPDGFLAVLAQHGFATASEVKKHADREAILSDLRESASRG